MHSSILTALVAIAAPHLSSCAPTGDALDVATPIDPAVTAAVNSSAAPTTPEITCAKTKARHGGLEGWLITGKSWPSFAETIAQLDPKAASAFQKHLDAQSCGWLTNGKKKKKIDEHYVDLAHQEAQQYFELKPKQHPTKLSSCIKAWLAYVHAPTDLCDAKNLVPDSPLPPGAHLQPAPANTWKPPSVMPANASGWPNPFPDLNANSTPLIYSLPQNGKGETPSMQCATRNNSRGAEEFQEYFLQTFHWAKLQSMANPFAKHEANVFKDLANQGCGYIRGGLWYNPFKKGREMIRIMIKIKFDPKQGDKEQFMVCLKRYIWNLEGWEGLCDQGNVLHVRGDDPVWTIDYSF